MGGTANRPPRPPDGINKNTLNFIWQRGIAIKYEKDIPWNKKQLEKQAAGRKENGVGGTTIPGLIKSAELTKVQKGKYQTGWRKDNGGRIAGK